MALSGVFYGSIRSGNYQLRVNWSATQNVGANTSKITCTMYLVQAGSWSLNIGSRDDNQTTINGTNYTWTSPALSNSGGKTTKLGTVTSGNITHNADGTKSVTLSATFRIEATISGTYYSTITASDTITLNTIPRATTPSISASSAVMGSAVTISMPRASSSFTHDLAYKVGSGSYVSIATGRGTSYSWTIPDVASQIPKATSVQLTVRCITKNGSTTVGTKYDYITATVPSNVVPAAPTVSIAEATSGLAAQFGAYIQGKTKLKVTISASGVKGSSITAYQTTLDGKTYTGSSFTSSALTKSGTLTMSTKVKDSRGRWSAAKTTSITVLAYATPKVQELSAFRVNSSGAGDEQGEYLRVDYRYSVTSLGSKNTAAAVIEYKRSTETTWATLLTNTALSQYQSIKPATPTFSTDYQYDLRLTVTDWFGASRSITTTLPSGAVIIDIKADGKGIAFGKTSEQAGIDFGWDLVGGVSNMPSNYTGQWKMPGGPLIQWGTVSITPSAANVPTSAAVEYVRPYNKQPLVFLSVVSSVPENCSVGVIDRAMTGHSVVLTRSGTTATGVNWLAIGPSD